jgi:hypothetical protein
MRDCWLLDVEVMEKVGRCKRVKVRDGALAKSPQIVSGRSTKPYRAVVDFRVWQTFEVVVVFGLQILSFQYVTEFIIIVKKKASKLQYPSQGEANPVIQAAAARN